MGPVMSSGGSVGSGGGASAAKPKQTFRQKLQGGDKWKGSSLQKSLQESGRQSTEQGNRMIEDARSEAASRIGPVQYKRGGKVRKTKKSERLMKHGGVHKVGMSTVGGKKPDKKRKKERKDSSR